MQQHHFADRLIAAIKEKQTPLVVGIDPRVNQLPPSLAVDSSDSSKMVADKVQQFSTEVIDAVSDLVPAVKPQAAFFEQLGPDGMVALGRVVDHAKAAGLQVIMDAKRGDIGSTAEAYAKAFLGDKPASTWGCDSLTINPYLGEDTLRPFIDRANETGSGLFVLVKTSNPGSDWLQEKKIDSQKVYQMIGAFVQSQSADSMGASGYGNVGAVVGATYPEQLAELRQAMPNTLFLIPGFGAQGGTAEDVAGGFDENKLGAVVNSSRGVIFAYERPQFEGASTWQQAVELAAKEAIARLAEI